MKKCLAVALAVVLFAILGSNSVFAQTPHVIVNRVWVYPVSQDVLQKLDEQGLLIPLFRQRPSTQLYAVVVRFSVPESESGKWYDNVKIALELNQSESNSIEIAAFLPQQVDESADENTSMEMAVESAGALRQVVGSKVSLGSESSYVRLYRRVWINQSPDGRRVVWTFRPADNNPLMPGYENPILPGMYYVAAIIEVPEADGGAVSVLGCCRFGEPNLLNPGGGFVDIKECNVSIQLDRSVPEGEAIAEERAPRIDTCDLEICGKQLAYGDVVKDEVKLLGRKCRYGFRGEAGDVVSVRMGKQNGNLDSFLDLVDAGGTILVSDDDSGGNGDSQISGYELPADGSYTIVARAYNDASTGAFELSLQRAVPAATCGDQIAYGDVRYGEIAATGNRCAYGFRGEAGDVVSVRMGKQNGNLDSFLDLVDAGGTILVSDDDSGGNGDSQISGYELPADGSYTIVARAYNDASTGAFELSLQKAVNDVQAGTIDALHATVPTYSSLFPYDDEEWSTWASDLGSAAIENEHLRVDSAEAYRITWSESVRQAGDLLIEVDIAFPDSTRAAEAAIIFRKQDSDNFYLVAVQNTGSVSLWRKYAGEWQALTPWVQVDTMDTAAGASNRVGVLAAGQQLAAIINGQSIQTAEDSTFDYGAVALGTGSFADPSVSVLFDNVYWWDIAAQQ